MSPVIIDLYTHFVFDQMNICAHAGWDEVQAALRANHINLEGGRIRSHADLDRWLRYYLVEIRVFIDGYDQPPLITATELVEWFSE